MPKPQTIIIKIPEPCSESWDEMKPNGCGRFCTHCEKTVIDFTTLADKDVAKIMLAANGNICGRFEDSQLNRVIVPESPKTSKPFSYLLSKIAASALLLQTFATNAFAQKNTVAIEQNENKAIAPTNKQIIIQGNVKDNNTQEPLIGMEISISGVNYKKYSDVSGNFRFVLPDTFLGKEITVKANYQSSSSKEPEGTMIQDEKFVIPVNSNGIEVTLKRYPVQVIDKIAITTPYGPPSTGKAELVGFGSVDKEKKTSTEKKTTWIERLFKSKNKSSK